MKTRYPTWRLKLAAVAASGLVFVGLYGLVQANAPAGPSANAQSAEPSLAAQDPDTSVATLPASVATDATVPVASTPSATAPKATATTAKATATPTTPSASGGTTPSTQVQGRTRRSG